jgi:hypothetical protein
MALFVKHTFHLFQVIGCIGALKLNERLLNTYWLILLGLLIGDVIVGGIWMVKFDHLTSGILIQTTT